MEIKKSLDLLGHKAEDKITGFKGIIDSVSFDLYGCVQFLVRPPMDKANHVPDSMWFDGVRLKIITEKPVIPQPMFKYPKGPAQKPVI